MGSREEVKINLRQEKGSLSIYKRNYSALQQIHICTYPFLETGLGPENLVIKKTVTDCFQEANMGMWPWARGCLLMRLTAEGADSWSSSPNSDPGI